MKKITFLLIFFFIAGDTALLKSASYHLGNTGFPQIDSLIQKGEYDKAREKANLLIQSEKTNQAQKLILQDKMEILRRIKVDFSKEWREILPDITKYMEKTQIKKEDWIKDNSLESKLIDGKRFFFHAAGANLFRVNSWAKKRKEQIAKPGRGNLANFLSEKIPTILRDSKANASGLSNPVKITLDFTLSVPADKVPAGETVRAWLPFPREGALRQQNVELLSTSQETYIIADTSRKQRSLYMEKTVRKGNPVVFNYKAEYLAYSQCFHLSVDKVKPYMKNSFYKKYTSERAPQIIFTPRIKEFSKEIVGNETHPLLKAKKIYDAIAERYPWASAREYSTIPNIPNYVLEQKHGDCGQVSLLFITLCRYNGIPAKWQSGWMLHPGSKNLHDWAEIYFEGIGWVPVDQSFARINYDSPEKKDFFFGNIDSYHLIINDDFSRPFYPAKVHLRSETIDFQRGEVEWRGGNLYFYEETSNGDIERVWDYEMKVFYENLK